MKSGHNLMFRCKFSICVITLCAYCLAPATAQSPLSVAIDTLVERDFEPFIGIQENDGPLLRRLSLDLRLVIPTQQELDDFLSDASPDRWARWVDRFLNDPLHKERMVDWLDKTLLQRRPFQHVTREKWLVYLRQVIDDGKPLDQIVKETVGSVWWNQSQRAQQRFFLERGGDSHAIARDVGRVFFGRDMQCAQCHNHPQVDDYLQIDYHGLLAFVSPSLLVETKFKDEKGTEQKLQVYAERAASDAPFESVFDKGILFRTGTRAPGGTELFEPFAPPDQRYQATLMPESLEGAPIPPHFSRRTSLLSQLSAANLAFAENWSNRLWALMIGRGLVHPLDMHHPDNPPTNPKLMDALTHSLIATGFDMRAFLKQIALSTTYQTGAHMPIEESLRLGSVMNLSAEMQSKLDSDLTLRKQSLEATKIQLASSATAAKELYAEAESAWRPIQKERVDTRAELDKSEASFNDLKKKYDVSSAAFEKARKHHADTASKLKLLEEAAEKLEQAKLLGSAEDPELQQAIATAKSKADSSKAALPNLEKAIADATAAHDKNTLGLDAERNRVMEVAAKLKPLEEKLHAADQIFVATRARWQKAQTEHAVALNQIRDVSRIQIWLDHSRAVGTHEGGHALAVQALGEHQSKLAKHATQIAAIQQQIADTTRGKETLISKDAIVQDEKKILLPQLELLRSTHASLDKSLVLVRSTESLDAAKQTIADAIESTLAKLSNIESTIASLGEELEGQIKLMESQTSQLSNVEQTRTELLKLVEQGETEVIAKAELVTESIDACAMAMQDVLEIRQKSAYLAAARPLSPEQLCLSILQSTNILNNYVAAELAELDKQNLLAVDASEELRSGRTLQATRQAIDKLRPHVDTFANLYSSGVGQTSDEFFASPDQALYMANGGSVFQWSAPSGNNVTAKMAQLPDGTVASTMLFRSLLSRDPTPGEQRWIGEMLDQAGERKPLVSQELVWSLLTSSEFRVYP